jgi:tetratricopeptide (TPR) repeat protein
MLRRFIASFATPGLLMGVALVMAAFYGADQFLAGLERRETGAEARALAHAGESFLRQGRMDAAIDAFNRAHLIERDNRYYKLALADALIVNRQPAKATAVLQEVLDGDSNDGRANLLMARAMTLQSRFTAAESYYHRAIYGSWPAGAGNQSVPARVELVSWLTEHGDRQSLLAELIPLEQRAKSDSAIAHQIPALYLQAGSVSQAEEAYRALIHQNPADAEAHAGLGQVELKRGNFHAAQQNFTDALAHKPGDAAWTRLEQLARSAHDLDPTSRRLTSAELFERSNRILDMARDAAQACQADPAQSALLVAQSALASKALRSPTNEAAQARLDLAEKLWHSRPASCSGSGDQAEVLALLIHKIEQ